MEENTQLPKEVFTRGDYVQPEGETAIVLVTGWTNTETNFRGVVVDTPTDAQFPLRLGEYSETWHTKKFKKVDYATKLHQANEVIKVLTYDNNRLKGQVEGYKEAHDDHKRLVRHLDLLINGDAAAEQASLCDLVKQIESFGLPAVNNPNYKGDAAWVKCWEQKPDTHKVRFKDKHGNEFIGNYSKDTGQYWAYGLGQAINDVIYWRTQDESAAGREDWISVDERPLIKRYNEWWELTEDGEKEFIAAVPYRDAETDDPTKDRWWIRHCYIDSEGYLNVKRDNEMDEDVAGWNVSDITHWRPLPEPPKQQKGK